MVAKRIGTVFVLVASGLHGVLACGEADRDPPESCASSACMSGGQPAAGGTGAGGTRAGAGAGGTRAGAGAGGTAVGGRSSGGEAGSGDSSGGTGPVSCSSGADCDGDVCDLLRGECVECLLNSDCGEGERCRGDQCEPRTFCEKDADCPQSDPRCDRSSFECEECTDHDHCGPGGFCTTNHVCEHSPACVLSSDCPGGAVCDVLGRCVECSYDSECGNEGKCLAGECASPCSDGGDCLDGKVCDPLFAACVHCVDNDGCPATHYCSYGRCWLDVCEEGDLFCASGTIYECQADGATKLTEQVCAPGCGQNEGVIMCNGSVCSAGAERCDGNTVQTCAVNGHSWVDSQDCADTFQICWQAKCESFECGPDTYVCQGTNRYQCTSDGHNNLLEKKCGLREVCDPEILDCATGLCVPYEPACDGNRATKCDEYGLGYTGASTDCGPLTCSNGSCVDCGELELKDALRLDEIASGLIAMRNVSGCAVSLEDVALDVSWASTRHVWKLPALELSPGEAIAFTPTGEQGLSGLEDATDAPYHKTIMICTGASALSGSGEAGAGGIDQSVCDADTVLDAVLFGLNAPELPSGLGWVGNLTPNIAAGDSVIRKRYSAVPTYFYDGHWEILP